MKQDSSTTLTNDFLSRFEAFESQLNGESKQPIHQVRKAAIAAFKELGIPSTKHEEYKFLSLIHI